MNTTRFARYFALPIVSPESSAALPSAWPARPARPTTPTCARRTSSRRPTSRPTRPPKPCRGALA